MEQNDNKKMPENPQSEIDELLKGYTKTITVEEDSDKEQPKKKRGRPRKDEEPEIKDSSLISGALFLLLIDLALPTLLCFVNNRFESNEKKKMKPKLMKLTKEQREELAPIADEAIKQLMIQASPLSVLIISLLGIYGLNFMMLKEG